MTDDTTTDDLLFEQASAAAMTELFGRGHPDPVKEQAEREKVSAALRAALAVYDEAAEEELDRLMEQVGFGGMDLTRGVKIHLKHAHAVAAATVAAFDELLNTRGAENYVEFEQTFTDPEKFRRYRVIVVRPEGRSPHDLRKIAEIERDELAFALRWSRGGPEPARQPDGGCCEPGSTGGRMVHEGTCTFVAADQPIMSLRDALAADDATWEKYINQGYLWNDPDPSTKRRIMWTPRDEPYAGYGGHLWRSDRGPYSFCHRPKCRKVMLRAQDTLCLAAPEEERVFGDPDVPAEFTQPWVRP